MALLLLWLNLVLGGIIRIDEQLQALFKQSVQNDKYNDKSCKRPSVKSYVQMTDLYKNKCMVPDSNEFVSSNYHKLLRQRSFQIALEFRHIWQGYNSTGAKKDSIKPVTGEVQNDKGGIRQMLFANLESLFFMADIQDFNNTVEEVLSGDLLSQEAVDTYAFTSDIVGGLLGVYDVTVKSQFRTRAIQAANLALPFYNYTHWKFPHPFYKRSVTEQEKPKTALKTAQIYELSQFIVLKDKLDPVFNQTFFKLGDFLRSRSSDIEMLTGFIKARDKAGHMLKFSDKPRLDSKTANALTQIFNIWKLLGDQQGQYFADIYKRSKDYIQSKLSLTSKKGTSFIAEGEPQKLTFKMNIGACSWAGQLAYQSYVQKYNHAEVLQARRLMDTCLRMFTQSPTQLAPSQASFQTGEMSLSFEGFQLNSDIFQGLFHLFRVTNDEYYRNAAYHIFSSIREKCKTKFGYSELDSELKPTNYMPISFPSKSLKYLFLMHQPEQVIRSKSLIFTPSGHIFSSNI